MPAFVATYVNPQGKSVLVDIEATDPAQAKRSLRLRGIRAIEIKAKPKTTATGLSAAAQLSEKLKFSKLNELLEAKPGIKDKAVFASKMSALVNAGVPIVRSIDLMASQQKMPPVQTGPAIDQPGGKSGNLPRRSPTALAESV